MRRSDREISNKNEILEVMEKCDVCRLAFNDTESGQVVLYFHGADAGRKYELIAKDNRAGFEMDCGHGLVMDEESGNCAMNYESVVGRGRIEIVSGKEKEDALRALMQHYRQGDFPYNKAVVPQTTVLKLTVEEISGKRRGKQS